MTATLETLLVKRRPQILALTARHGVHNVRVFGSMVRGEATPDSDIDFLVTLEPGRSLLDLGELIIDLQDLLGRQVDVVPENSLHWYVRDRVLHEAIAL